MRAVSGSGTMIMSEALIGCQPRIDEPSNARPSSNRPSFRRAAGMVVCCQIPGKSTNLRSTYLTSCFFARSNTSFGVMFPPQTVPTYQSGALRSRNSAEIRSDGFLAALAGADSYYLLDGDDEDFAIADAPGL